MLIIIAIILFLILNVMTGGKFLESLYATLGLMLLAYIFISNWDVLKYVFAGLLGLIFFSLVFTYWNKPKFQQPLPKTTADDRKQMLTNAEEIEERIFQHPDNCYLLVGKSGGVKIYRNLDSARNARGPVNS